MNSIKTFFLIVTVCAGTTAVGAFLVTPEHLVLGSIAGAIVGGIAVDVLCKTMGWRISPTKSKK